MTPDSQAAIISNDLSSMMHRIEALPAHPRYTDALLAVQAAMIAVNKGRLALHQAGMRRRLGRPLMATEMSDADWKNARDVLLARRPAKQES